MFRLDFDIATLGCYEFEGADAAQKMEQRLKDKSEVGHASYKGVKIIMVTETVFNMDLILLDQATYLSFGRRSRRRRVSNSQPRVVLISERAPSANSF